MPMQIGLSTYALTWAIGVPGSMPEKPMSVFEFIDKAIELNLNLVQIADNLPLHKFSAQELEQIKSYAKRKNISIEVGARKMTLEKLEEYIRIASFLQSPILRFVIDGENYQPGIEEICSIINRMLPALKKAGIILAIENHDRFIASQFKEIIYNTDKEHVGICLDSVNSLGANEDIWRVTEILAPYTVNLHIKEYIIKRVYHKMGFIVEGVPAGLGMLPLKWIASMVTERCKTAVLEQWTPPEKDIHETISKENEWAKESIKNLKEII